MFLGYRHGCSFVSFAGCVRPRMLEDSGGTGQGGNGVVCRSPPNSHSLDRSFHKLDQKFFGPRGQAGPSQLRSRRNQYRPTTSCKELKTFELRQEKFGRKRKSRPIAVDRLSSSSTTTIQTSSIEAQERSLLHHSSTLEFANLFGHYTC